MVVVFCPIAKQKIIELIENYRKNEKQIFSFDHIEGIKIFFKTTINDLTIATKTAKHIMSTSELGSALNYTIIPFDGHKFIWF